MAKVLFVTSQDIKKKTFMSGNVDQDKFKQFVFIAQEVRVRNYLGTDLYNKIASELLAGTISGGYATILNDFIKPMVIHFAMEEYLPFAPYSLSNGGVYKHTSENSQLADKSEIDLLVAKHNKLATYYADMFIRYMAFHSNDFPEYNSNTNEDIVPDKDATFNGWVI